MRFLKTYRALELELLQQKQKIISKKMLNLFCNRKIEFDQELSNLLEEKGIIKLENTQVIIQELTNKLATKILKDYLKIMKQQHTYSSKETIDEKALNLTIQYLRQNLTKKELREQITNNELLRTLYNYGLIETYNEIRDFNDHLTKDNKYEFKKPTLIKLLKQVEEYLT